MSTNIVLDQRARQKVSEFLSDKPHKSVLVCENGFLDAEEGVPVSDEDVIKWVESSGGNIEEILD
jgi:predicted transcriptional regulator